MPESERASVIDASTHWWLRYFCELLMDLEEDRYATPVVVGSAIGTGKITCES
jgi:hypothetical protein